MAADGRRGRAGVGACRRGSISDPGPHAPFASCALEPALAWPWGGSAPYRQPPGHGIDVLRRDHAHGASLAAYGQGSAAPPLSPRRQKLLDPAPASGTGAPIHAQSILEVTMLSLLTELWAFLRVRKKFWLFPIVFMMVVFGALVVLSQGSAVAPFIYTLF